MRITRTIKENVPEHFFSTLAHFLNKDFWGGAACVSEQTQTHAHFSAFNSPAREVSEPEYLHGIFAKLSGIKRTLDSRQREFLFYHGSGFRV